jgi:hypothetical protein
LLKEPIKTLTRGGWLAQDTWMWLKSSTPHELMVSSTSWLSWASCLRIFSGLQYRTFQMFFKSGKSRIFSGLQYRTFQMFFKSGKSTCLSMRAGVCYSVCTWKICLHNPAMFC